MGKAAVILSLLLNLAFLGAVGATYVFREADAAFMYDYFSMEPESRQAYREGNIPEWVAAAREEGAESPEDFKKYIVEFARNEAEKEAILEMISKDAAVGVQRLITDAARLQRNELGRRSLQHEASVEQIKVLNSEFPDFIAKMQEQQEEVNNREKDFEVRKKRWQDNAKNEALQQIVTNINEAKKPADAVSWIEGLSVDKQWFVISSLEAPDARNAILDALPEAQRNAVKAFMTKPVSTESSSTIGSPGE